MSTALFDIGGTKTRVSITRNGTTFRRALVYPTPRHYRQGIQQLDNAIRTIADGWKISRIIGSIAAPLDTKHTKTIAAANLSNWFGFPITADLHHRFQVPVRLENDAALAGLGEATRGAGRGYRIVAYLTLSTGVGGVRIVRQSIDDSAVGFEPGNIVVSQTKDKVIQLDTLISGAGLSRRYRQAPELLKGRAVWRELEHNLALGLTTVTALWSPHIIVLGGAIGRSPQLQLKNVRSIVRRTLLHLPEPPKIVKGTLGDVAGLWGAMALLKKG